MKQIVDEPLSADARALLAELTQGGWVADYSPTCEAWRMVNVDRRWSTSLYYDATKAIEAADSVTQRAEVTLREWERRCRDLQKYFGVTG